MEDSEAARWNIEDVPDVLYMLDFIVKKEMPGSGGRTPPWPPSTSVSVPCCTAASALRWPASAQLGGAHLAGRLFGSLSWLRLPEVGFDPRGNLFPSWTYGMGRDAIFARPTLHQSDGDVRGINYVGIKPSRSIGAPLNKGRRYGRALKLRSEMEQPLGIY